MGQLFTNAVQVLGSVGDNTVYTVPDTKTAIVNGVRRTELVGNTPSYIIKLKDESANLFYLTPPITVVAYSTATVFDRPFTMGEKEKIVVNTTAANEFDFFFAILENDRGSRNLYKNVMTDLTTTDSTALYTVPDGKTAILNSWRITNTNALAAAASYVYATNAAGTDFVWNSGTIAGNTTVQTVSRPHVMREKEKIKIKAGTANYLHSVASLLEITITEV